MSGDDCLSAYSKNIKIALWLYPFTSSTSIVLENEGVFHFYPFNINTQT